MSRDISLIKSSRFLAKSDVDPEITLTVREVVEENVAMEGAPEEIKFVVYFNEHEKGLVANWTNAQLFAQITGSTDMDQWTGHRVTAYHDPSVSFGGKLVGGIRIKAPMVARPVAAQSEPPLPPEFDDNLAEVPNRY